jgi:hypothetical protein
LDVAGDEFFINLLFLHIPTVRYVVLELEVEKFKPGHLEAYAQRYRLAL